MRCEEFVFVFSSLFIYFFYFCFPFFLCASFWLRLMSFQLVFLDCLFSRLPLELLVWTYWPHTHTHTCVFFTLPMTLHTCVCVCTSNSQECCWKNEVKHFSYTISGYVQMHLFFIWFLGLFFWPFELLTTHTNARTTLLLLDWLFFFHVLSKFLPLDI